MKPCNFVRLIAVTFLFFPLFSANAFQARIMPTAELGFVKAIHHDIQIGNDGYRFDYVKEGGQEILLPFYRFEIAALLCSRHEISFLLQPLTLKSETRVDNTGGIKIDDLVFADDTPLDLKYGFDFYRLTYRYRFTDTDKWKLSIGGSFQIRNASISFNGYDDTGKEIRAISQDLGPVAVISFAARRNYESFFIESTIEGFYAPVKYLNLRDVDVIGWLYDGAFRAGLPLENLGEVYISARFLGGGAEGTAGTRRFWTQSRTDPRFTWNNLNLAALTLGIRRHL